MPPRTTTHYHPPPSATTHHPHHHPPPSTSSHHEPKHIDQLPTTIYHHPKYILHHPPPPTTTWKMDHHPAISIITLPCLTVGRACQISHFGEKALQIHLIIIRKWPKNTPPPFDFTFNCSKLLFYNTSSSITIWKNCAKVKKDS